MRVIAGEFGGRRLHAADAPGLRPTSDRVREALFSILGDAVEGSEVLDLYAGTGALALEAISRGAARATCVERGRVARRALERNVAALGLEDRVEIRGGDALAFARRCEAEEASFDGVFCDPPYADPLEPVAEALSGAWWSTFAVVEHAAGRAVPAPDHVEIDERRYGDTAVTVWWRR